MARKKIVFVIVEGPSDEEALGAVLSRLYSNDEVFVYITHGDITSEFTESARKNIFTRVTDLIKEYANIYGVGKAHFKEIIHIVDTDGTYIPAVYVTEDLSVENPLYFPNEIRTKNKSAIEDRNKRKSANINKLCSRQEIWDIPYHVYYMSCNLDHVLYGKLNCTDEEKENNSYKFAKYYKERIPDFISFISTSDFSVQGEYKESWDFIKQDLNSLHRHTNLGIGLPTPETDSDRN